MILYRLFIFRFNLFIKLILLGFRLIFKCCLIDLIGFFVIL